MATTFWGLGGLRVWGVWGLGAGLHRFLVVSISFFVLFCCSGFGFGFFAGSLRVEQDFKLFNFGFRIQVFIGFTVY